MYLFPSPFEKPINRSPCFFLRGTGGVASCYIVVAYRLSCTNNNTLATPQGLARSSTATCPSTPQPIVAAGSTTLARPVSLEETRPPVIDRFTHASHCLWVVTASHTLYSHSRCARCFFCVTSRRCALFTQSARRQTRQRNALRIPDRRQRRCCNWTVKRAAN